MRKLIFLATTCIVIYSASCKKEKDIIDVVNIHGKVNNLCNDSGMANITVKFVSQTSGGGDVVKTISDLNGNFYFYNVSINHNSGINYFLNIESKSGTGDIGFTGTTELINKDNVNLNYVLNVVPFFDYLIVKMQPPVAVVTPDTFTVRMEQRIIHKNLPDQINTFLVSSGWVQPGYPSYSDHYCYGYPMGKWYLETDKFKNGIHSIIHDSIYMNWGANATYIVPW